MTPSGARRSLSDLPPSVVEDILRRMQGIAPELLAVLVYGSYARGEAAAASDLDLVGLYRSELHGDWYTWFLDGDAGRLHVSAGAFGLEEWRQHIQEPANWSLGFPTEEAAVFLWATDEARRVLGDPPVIRRPSPEPELEDVLESAVKVKRALRGGDMAGARLFAQDLAKVSPRLLLPLNPPRRVATPRDALAAALELPVAPPHFAEDLAVCLGVHAAGDDALAQAALRLPQQLLAFLRERLPTVDPQPELTAYMRDGTLEQHLERA